MACGRQSRVVNPLGNGVGIIGRLAMTNKEQFHKAFRIDAISSCRLERYCRSWNCLDVRDSLSASLLELPDVSFERKELDRDLAQIGTD